MSRGIFSKIHTFGLRPSESDLRSEPRNYSILTPSHTATPHPATYTHTTSSPGNSNAVMLEKHCSRGISRMSQNKCYINDLS